MGLTLQAGCELLQKRFQPAAPEAALGEGSLLPQQILQLRHIGVELEIKRSGERLEQLQRRQGNQGDAAGNRIGQSRRIRSDGGEGLQPSTGLCELLGQQQPASDLKPIPQKRFGKARRILKRDGCNMSCS